jgi:hypothetical protein
MHHQVQIAIYYRALGTGKVRSLFYPIISTAFGRYLKEMPTFRLGKRLIKSEFSRRCPEQYKQ